MNKHYVLVTDNRFVVFDPFEFKTSTDINDAEVYTVNMVTSWFMEMKELLSGMKNATKFDMACLTYKEVKVKL